MTVTQKIEARNGILVAHDGSTHANGALRTAARWAGAMTTHVTVVRAWNLSTAPRPDSWAPGYMPPLEDFEAATLRALEQDVKPVRTAYPDVMITAAVVHGSPAEKLIEASNLVDLIVVGSRGHGGFAGLVLGSVSEQVVRHAQCPVLVDKLRTKPDIPKNESVDDAEVLEKALVSELKLD